MGRRGCASAMGMIKFPSSCSSPKALCNQFIDYYICSRGVFCINHIKLRNFVVITIECSIATVNRGSIMTRIYRWSMMVYSSLQAEFMVTKYDGHIHRYGAQVRTQYVTIPGYLLSLYFKSSAFVVKPYDINDRSSASRMFCTQWWLITKQRSLQIPGG